MRNIKPHHVISAVVLGGLFFAVLNFNNKPFRPIEEFVIFATDKVELAQDVQSLRGNIGSNEEIKIGEQSQIIGDLFSNEISLAEGVIINGNVFARQLRLSQKAQILGASSTTITFPVAQIPAIPPFTFGAQNIKILTNQETTLSPGSFRDLEIGENSRVIFQSGTYNLRTFKARQNSKLILENGAIFNIAESITIDNNVFLFSKNNQIKPENILFQTLTNSTINIGQNTNLTFRLIAPNANVQIGQDSLIRGNIWAREIFIGERATLRDTVWFAIPSKPDDIVQVGNSRIFINIVNVNFTGTATIEDAERIAQLINAEIVGFGPTTNLYSFRISTRTKEELDAAIAKIDALNDPKIEGVFFDIQLRIIPKPF